MKTIAFEISDEQENKIKEFVAQQRKILVDKQRIEMPAEDFSLLTVDGKFPYTGAIGGELTYHYTRTSVGDVIKVSYLNATLDVSEYDLW